MESKNWNEAVRYLIDSLMKQAEKGPITIPDAAPELYRCAAAALAADLVHLKQQYEQNVLPIEVRFRLKAEGHI